RLRQIGGAALHVRKRRQRRIPAWNRVEPAAAFVGLATPRDINSLGGSRERRLAPRRDEIFVEERDRVVARVALSADEPGGGIDRQTLCRQDLAHARIVGHLREGARIRPAASAAARA